MSRKGNENHLNRQQFCQKLLFFQVVPQKKSPKQLAHIHAVRLHLVNIYQILFLFYWVSNLIYQFMAYLWEYN